MKPPGFRLTEDQLIAWLRLIRSENVGPVTFHALVSRFGDAQRALDALPDLARRGGSRRVVRIAERASIESELRAAERMEARFVHLGHPQYPALLSAMDAPPPVLAVMGDIEIAGRAPVAIVGARNASAAGIRLAAGFAAELGQAGSTIVSGLARGIDTAAHQASLATGTIGVFAGGLDKPYPSENKPLMRRIVNGGGGLVTEMPFGWEPRAADFPRRNRIVVGLGLAVLVVEAAQRSGSLISARLAGEMGRLVFAIPGSPLEARSAGTNALLRDGASFALEPGDILRELAPMTGGLAAPRPLVFDAVPESTEEASNEVRARIVRALSPVPIGLEDLADAADAGVSELQTVLLELELAGRLDRHSGGRVSLTG